MLLLQTPIETTNYMIMGFAVIFGTIGFYLFTLYIRRKNLKQDLELLEEYQED